jgi:hypothetical protein
MVLSEDGDPLRNEISVGLGQDLADICCECCGCGGGVKQRAQLGGDEAEPSHRRPHLNSNAVRLRHQTTKAQVRTCDKPRSC